MLEETSSIFAKLFAFALLLLLLSSKCNTVGDAHQIQLQFNHSHGKVKPIDIEDHYQNYVAIKNLTSHRLPILCTVKNYETTFSAETNVFTRRIKANVLCALPAKGKATTGNESSTSYMSRHKYGIASELASLIGGYSWLKPETVVYGQCDRISDLDIVAFDLNSCNPTPNAGGIVEMATTLSFSTSKPVHYYTELGISAPVRSNLSEFVSISPDEKNHKNTQLTGFWIDTFKKAAAIMATNTTRKKKMFRLCSASIDESLNEVSGKDYDAAIGLPVIRDYQRMVTDQIYVGLSSPYFEKGSDQLRKEDLELNQVFSFMMPFTNVMWSTLSAMTVFNVFVIWLVESTTSHESGSLPFGQVGAILWFPIAILFYGGHRESPRNNLTYFVLAPWFILILVVSSTYTQSFTSMITSSDTEASPCWLDIKNLKKTNAIVGCDMKHSIMFQYLVKVIGFQKKNIKHIAQSSFDDYAKALSTGNIKAAFFWTPDDCFFLAKYCKSFGNPNCNRHGSSIVFQRGSSFVNEMLEAVLGFKQMKEEDLDMLSLSDCSSSTSDGTMKRGIGPGPFSGLFILSGSASTIALLITVFRLLRRGWERLVQGMLMDRGIWVWLSTLFCRSQRGNQLQLQLIMRPSRI
ncbi:hypothetical protein ES288_D03G027600v1 [Gossypium darwinii]|uniref:Ionotropic glutamate receptor C-terminal domain-containing protein n=2 Tax=Gossypium darwinii TaxID=34276 RepID=A0A5D2D505_GOSDA|nr:hypothetical protein ES288_D03G027600v1 [Gossypium darwinii]